MSGFNFSGDTGATTSVFEGDATVAAGVSDIAGIETADSLVFTGVALTEAEVVSAGFTQLVLATDTGLASADFA